MEEPVDVIRECSRAALTVSRRTQRDDETDSHRHIVSENVTPTVVADIAIKLKSKTSVSAADLRILKNSLLDDTKHIEVVLNTNGALRGLVRELTGHDAQRALHAAGCICNVSLGDARACTAVAKAAGTYLIAALPSLHTEMAATCARALANCAGGGAGAAAVLMSQGAAAALPPLVTSHDRHASDAAATALAHLATDDSFSKEHALPIIQALSRTRLIQPSLQLLFILSCREDFNELITEELLQNVLEHATSMETIDNSFVYAIRTLANIDLNDHVYNVIARHFSMNIEVLKKALMSDEVVKSVLWLLGNLFNFKCDSELFNALLS
ncbi:uncharacterized protein LOC125230387 [Leguminivora glycinivorella]|uniref:uncharacterized protein LOC125230387 n=1 Tax=Leguminivora glycinivorella TaxID=1035111 RepID=UPI00200ED4CE|nr:uncharacterized protein LOC125230387 [Leguminivora glycinivorella]